MNNKMVNGVVGGAVVEVDRRESESKGCDVFYPFGLAPPGVDTYVLWCVDRGRHNMFTLKRNRVRQSFWQSTLAPRKVKTLPTY
jgi:hypothetical protein